jgi:hypothetical protein
MGRLRCALATLVAGVLLVACSDDDPEPKVSDPTPSAVSTSAAVTASPSASADDADPEVTIRSWVDDWNRALRSGDTSALRAYESESCRGCDELVGPVEEIAEAGGSFEGGSWTIAGLKAVSETQRDAQVNLAVDVAQGSTAPSAGADPTAYPATKHLLRFRLARDGELWRISVIEVLS